MPVLELNVSTKFDLMKQAVLNVNSNQSTVSSIFSNFDINF